MTEEQKQLSDELDAILINWFRWCLSYQLKTGYPPRAAYHQYLWHNDVEVDSKEAEIVDFEINQMSPEKRGVLSICTRNKHNKLAVFRSARYSREEMHAIYLEAKAEILDRLIKRGVIKA